MSVLAIVERTAHRRLDAGSSWRDLAAPLPDDFLRRVDHYTKEVWINLLGLPYDHPEAQSGAGFLETVRAMSAEDVLLYLVGYYRRVFRRETPAQVMADAVAGDKAATPRVPADVVPRAGGMAWGASIHAQCAGGGHPCRVRQLVEVWLTHVFAEREADLLALTQADAEALARLPKAGRSRP